MLTFFLRINIKLNFFCRARIALKSARYFFAEQNLLKFPLKKMKVSPSQKKFKLFCFLCCLLTAEVCVFVVHEENYSLCFSLSCVFSSLLWIFYAFSYISVCAREKLARRLFRSVANTEIRRRKCLIISITFFCVHHKFECCFVISRAR